MEVGDRKEWVWSDSQKENLIIVRKMGLIDYEASMWSSSEDSSCFESDLDDDNDELKDESDDDFDEEKVKQM